MPFNDIEKQRIKKLVGGFCEERVPDHLRSQIKLFYEIRGFEVKIIEFRPVFKKSHIWSESPIARIKYDPKAHLWQLYCIRSSGRWMKYPDLKPTNRLKDLVEEIKKDPLEVF